MRHAVKKKLVTVTLVLLLQLMKISPTPFLVISNRDFNHQFGRKKERNGISRISRGCSSKKSERRGFRKSVTSDVVVLKGVLLTVTFLVV